MSTLEMTIHISGMSKSAAKNRRPQPHQKSQEPTAARTAEVRAAHSHPNITWEAATMTSLRR